jgi:hypothetical protein
MSFTYVACRVMTQKRGINAIFNAWYDEKYLKGFGAFYMLKCQFHRFEGGGFGRHMWMGRAHAEAADVRDPIGTFKVEVVALDYEELLSPVESLREV